MRVYVESYGCAQNQGEGAQIARDLARQGHALANAPDAADVGVLVTCGVIGPTESRMIRRWETLSSRVPRLVVTGCLVPLRTDLFRGEARGRTTFVPIREQPHLAGLLDAWAVDRSPTRLAPSVPVPTSVSEEVVIAQGCTSGCTYCFSRLARGRLTSEPIERVVARTRDAVGRGAREIRLTGLDTAAWGADLVAPQRLPELLDAVGAAAGLARVRVGMMSPQSLEPFRDRYWEALGHGPAYRFLHLPVQSGSNTVLAGMKRGYTADLFRRQVAAARASMPDLHLATDVIVGFPGETEDDFRATEALLESVEPETVNVTRFSPRAGTPAAHLPRLSPRVAKRRSRVIAEARHRIARRRLERYLGGRFSGRVTEYGPDGSAVARLPNYLPVVLASRPELGSDVELRVDGARSTYLLGSVLSAASK